MYFIKRNQSSALQQQTQKNLAKEKLSKAKLNGKTKALPHDLNKHKLTTHGTLNDQKTLPIDLGSETERRTRRRMR
jgi:hypothetical protein